MTRSSAREIAVHIIFALGFDNRSAQEVLAAELTRARFQELTEELLAGYLYSAGVPDPDLLIRPGGELRQSNFLLWQCAYSEFYTTDVLWPEFTKEELHRAIASYQRRSRRYGGLREGTT